MNDTIRKNITAYIKKYPQIRDLYVIPSDVGNKRLTAIFNKNGKYKTVHFGLRGAFTYADGASKQKRDSYRARASKITNANGRFTYKIPGTANSFAYHLLW